jgi:hypothetical protein
MQDFPSLESLLEIRHSTTKAAASASSAAEEDDAEDPQGEGQGPSVQQVVGHTKKRFIEKHPAHDPDLRSVIYKATTASRKKTSSVRSMSPVPPCVDVEVVAETGSVRPMSSVPASSRAEQNAVSRPVEPITGQTYELLILAAMSVRLLFNF